MSAGLSTQPYKGTRDFYPEDLRARAWMFNRLRSTLERFGYEEYDGPMLEPFALYASKTSEEIVNEQLYWMIDRGERKLAVRPEMTPTLARMVAAKIHELPRPIRWFSIPNLWRYERPQRGRLREHWQLNVDVFGGARAAEDLEICQVIHAIFDGFGAKKGYEVRINHRGLTNFILADLLKIPAEKQAMVGRLLDGAPKMGEEKFRAALAAESVPGAVAECLLDLFKPGILETLAPKLAGCAAWNELSGLLGKLRALGLESHFRFDPSIMRGFLYYTGLVLEVFDLHPENNRALFGGGRYDNLVGMFGGPALSGVGFGMGDVTLRHFLEVHRLAPDLNAPHGVLVAHLADEQETVALGLARQLRELTQVRVLTSLSAEKPKKIFTMAERLRARHVIFVGSAEAASGTYSMKDIVSGEQFAGPAEKLALALAPLVSKG